ncbi:MAG: hypothetical protein ACOVP5_07275 [Chitinophagales bacterium]
MATSNTKTVTTIINAPTAPAPAARLQIGQNNTIEIDTLSAGGKKTFQIKIMSDDDTIIKEIEDVVQDIQSEIEDVKDVVSEREFAQELQHRDDEHTLHLMQNTLGMIVPVLIIGITVAFLAFRSYQNRKWKEMLLSKGATPQEILNLDKKKESIGAGSDNLETFEKRRMMKWAIGLGSFGLAAIIGSEMGFAYFVGFFALFLASGLFYYYNKMA